MKFFIPKPYQLQKNKKWIPAADIIDGVTVTDEYSIREQECDTEEEANKFIAEFLIKKGFKKIT